MSIGQRRDGARERRACRGCRAASEIGGPRSRPLGSGFPLRAAGLALVALGLVTACGPGDAAGGEGRAGDEARPGVRSAGSQDTGAADTADTVSRGSETTQLRIDGITVTAEVADEDAERQRGLMHRDSLPEDHGMLFVYPEERTLSFWMRNTRIPLDIAFIDRNGRIVDIQQMQPQSDEQHRSAEPAMYALEMELGWFEEHGIEVGAQVSF